MVCRIERKDRAIPFIPDAYHTFLLLKSPAGCRVVTEEVVRGPGAVEFRKKDPNGMHRGHDLWLSVLKQVSEEYAEAAKENGLGGRWRACPR